MLAFRANFQPADHIYTAHCDGLYCHHGIFVGKAKLTNPNDPTQNRKIDDAVIHFLGPRKKKRQQCARCFNMPYMEGVVITCLDCFGEGYSITVYEYNVSSWRMHVAQKNGTCSSLPSYPPDMVLRTAFDFLEGKRYFGEYNVVFNNCEDFTTFCKTGKARCNQIAELFGLPGSIAYRTIKRILY